MTGVTFLLRRCAWCSRVWTRHGWCQQEPREPARETATICDECVNTLRANGVSH